jgi:hypothetical protein
MEITLSLPDELVGSFTPSALESFIENALRGVSQKTEQQPIIAAKTKWQKVVDEIETGAFGLGNYTEQFKRDCAEFRNTFELDRIQ